MPTILYYSNLDEYNGLKNILNDIGVNYEITEKGSYSGTIIADQLTFEEIARIWDEVFYR